MATASYDTVLAQARQLPPTELRRLVQDLVEALEDEEDAAWAREYEARKASGRLTPDEQEAIPLDQAIAEIERDLRST